MEDLTILEEAQTIFHHEQVVRNVDYREAIRVGRGLTEAGCRMIGGFAVLSDSEQTVGQILAEMERSKRYQQGVVRQPDTFVGPYFASYGKDNQFNWCPQGIGVWERTQNQS